MKWPCCKSLFFSTSILTTAILMLAPGPLVAHGWHNATLMSHSLDEWLSDIKNEIPDVNNRMQTRELRAGRSLEDLNRNTQPRSAPEGMSRPRGRVGQLDVHLTPQQQALFGRKSHDCIEVLAYMQSRNIFPDEFPNFPMEKIPRYRQAAKQLLTAMGPVGTSAVCQKLRGDLMRTTQWQGDISVHPSYFHDMVDVLRKGAEAGNMSAGDAKGLLEATQGAIANGRDPAAVNAIRTTLVQSVDLATLIELLSKRTDRRLESVILAAIRKRARESKIVDLLRLLDVANDARLRDDVKQELKTRKPTYREIKYDLGTIWELARSSNGYVAEAAREQVVNAFRRAPMHQCLYWLGQGDKALAEFIWQQVDARIARADGHRRAGYRDHALLVIGDKRFNQPSKAAAIDLLKRLNDPKAVAPLAELLPKMPRELWPKTGRLLHDLTGEDYGPKPGDGIGRVVDAAKKWRALVQQERDP